MLKDPIIAADGTVSKAEVAIGYGALFEAAIDFLIIGFTIFVVVKFMNRLMKKAEDTKDATVVTPKNIELLSRLTDLIEEQNDLLKVSDNPEEVYLREILPDKITYYHRYLKEQSLLIDLSLIFKTIFIFFNHIFPSMIDKIAPSSKSSITFFKLFRQASKNIILS